MQYYARTFDVEQVESPDAAVATVREALSDEGMYLWRASFGQVTAPIRVYAVYVERPRCEGHSWNPDCEEQMVWDEPGEWYCPERLARYSGN